MKSKKNSTLLLVTILILGVILACEIIPPEPERDHSEDYGEYTFDPNTILDSLAKGDLNRFISITETLSTPTPQTSNDIQLEFTDLLYIAQKFHQFHWSEPVADWNLHQLQYQVECSNFKGKPSFLEIVLYKIIRSQETDTRLVHTIQIGHPDGTIYWTEATRYPVNENWQVIDLTKNTISAEEALKIAEGNGGMEVRLSADNNCRINILAPDLSKKEWLVRYASYSPDTGWRYLLEVYVDKTSGEFRVVHPK